MKLKLTTWGDSVLSNPFVDGLGGHADCAGQSTLTSEELNCVIGVHARDVTLVAGVLQLQLNASPPEVHPLWVKLCAMEFSSRLFQARTEAKKTQEQVAAACGISHAAISKAESGKTEAMTAANLFAIADFLGCDARWLATGEGDMHPPRNELDALTAEQRQVVLSVINSMK